MGQHKYNPNCHLAREGKLPPKPKPISKRERERLLYAKCQEILYRPSVNAHFQMAEQAYGERKDNDDLISRKALLAEYDRIHVGPPGGARKLMEDAPAVDEPHWATETAFKNGYEQGKKDALKWIPVSERLPHELLTVIIAVPNGKSTNVMPAYLANGWWKASNDWCYEKDEVSHWMPLPEPPEGVRS